MDKSSLRERNIH